jgi:hypothetical protein
VLDKQPSPTAGATQPATIPTATAGKVGNAPAPRVGELMSKAGCKGGLIGTQLYSRETGRCQYRGTEVTIAAFESNELRDRWVEFGRQFGATMVTGERWAAGVGGPDQAKALAVALGGDVA